MKRRKKFLFLLGCLGLFIGLGCHLTGKVVADSNNGGPVYGEAQLIGRLGDDRLIECSGMDVSQARDGLLWAINDSGQEPYIYAMGLDGQSLGRLRVIGAQNRDWEGIDTFVWQGRPMILIADIGDNRVRHETHTLYVLEEPTLSSEQFGASASVNVAWRILFSYPDRNHDAEGVAVDTRNQKILVLTKRDNPPVMFEVPLITDASEGRILAKQVTKVRHIPPPSDEDLAQKYGKFRSQPTAMDLSDDGTQAVVLTHKHAYLFKRRSNTSWADAFSRPAIVIVLPLPQDCKDFSQREAICFARGGKDLWVTSEGLGAGIFRLKAR